MALDPNINRIKFLRSTTAGAVPATSLLQDGELAINLVDRTIYSKNGANVVELGFGKGGSVKGNVAVTGTISATSTITAPTFSGALSGNAATATKLQTARTISLTGSATGSISFDGTSNQSISVNVNAVDSLATYARSNADSPTKWAQGVQSVFVSSTQGWPMPYGGVITARPHSNGGGTLQILTAYGSGSNDGAGEIKIRTGDYSVTGNDGWTSWKTLIHSENVGTYAPTLTGSGASGTWGISISGNASTATKLATARTIGGVSFNGTENINLPGVNTTGNQNTTGSAASLTTARSFSWTGDATGSLSFNGSANVSAALTLANSGVSAGTYKSVTVDPKGRVTAGTNVVTGLVTSTAATGTTNAATTNTNTYLNIVETIGSAATTVGTSTQVTGAGTVTVTSDTAGKLTITGSQTITGNAATATKLATARTIGGVSFDGSANINLPGVNTAGNQNTSGNASTATKLQTARTINGKSFDGTANIVIGYLEPIDNRTIKPNATPKRAVTPYFTSAGGLTTSTANSVYGDLLVLNGYSDTTGGNVNAIWFGKNTQELKHYYAAQGATTWGTPKTIAYTDSNITGNAATATALQTARTINGTSFNGTANITTANWGTARTLTVGRTGKSVNGSANISWSADEILPTGTNGQVLKHNGTSWVAGTDNNTTYTAMTASEATTGTATTARLITPDVLKSAITTHAPVQTTITGNAATATKLQTERTINGTSFNGSANITTANWGTARTISIGGTAKSVNGAANVTWTAQDIGLQYLGTAATKAISYNAQTIAENITVPANVNALSAGPITINTGYTVTISDGATWSIV